MSIYSPQDHKSHRSVHDQTEERLDRLENDVHTLARLVFSARHTDKQDKARRATPTQQQQQKERWNCPINPFDAPPTPKGDRTTWSHDQPIKFASPKKNEQRPGDESVEAKSGSKQSAKLRCYPFRVATAVLCSIAIWLFLGGDAAFGELYRAVEWLKHMYAEKWLGA
ncbi:hypothetical protein PpBr36_01668 [Pyricularia pennisetigena]|uniref:hypothetical protein n=1 Tax=Pyricularia pennisetigena TaxID=1578925 RepID=UPI00114F03F3|nr:hypothetical protein PpBr36_01668 [Pyricularia pennisetigena]TLS28110.1 hypothetical protein PpBr36_01668 [Pyricularia pennisetigena]